MMNEPPKIFLRIFRWYCHPKLLDQIEGDLIEVYKQRLEKVGKRKADIKFFIDVVLLFRPNIIKPMEGYKNLNNYGMIKSYFKIGWRNLLRNKGYSAINIAGLTLGITCSIVLFLLVTKGNSFDKYHAKGERIYRVVSKLKSNTGYSFTQGIPPALPDAFKEDISGVEEVVFTSYRRGNLITVYNKSQIKKYEEPKGVAYSEPSFFKIFDRKIIIGSAAKGIDDANEAIISAKWANKYFGKMDAVGELIEYENIQYKITAVMEDFPDNTDLPFDLILSYATIKKATNERWGDVSDADNCYFLLKKNVAIGSIEKQLQPFEKKYIAKDEAKNEAAFILQPLFKIHSDNRFGNYNTKLPIEAQIVFSVIGLFLLITACINFINLATAEAVKRTREVGIRKVLGSSRGQLVNQLMIEAFTVTVIAVLVSLGMVQFALRLLNPLMEFSISFNLFTDSKILIFLGVLTIAISILAGFYPAWMVSGFQPVFALKKQMGGDKSSVGYTLRKGLVIFQFFISQFFLIATIVITRQMDFLQTHETGFSKEAIITVPIPNTSQPNDVRGTDIHTLKNEILRLPGVERASLDYSPPSHNAVLSSDFTVDGLAEKYYTQIKQVDGDYIELYGIKLVAGQLLPDLDSITCVVVNEKFVKTVGLHAAQDMIGKEISFWDRKLTVKGVVKDFNTQSLSDAIEPVVLINDINGYHSLSIKIHPSKMQETIEQAEKIWEAKYPEYIFSFSFVDEQIKNLYRGERKIISLLNIFTGVAIFIGCLGLLGLIAFVTNQKTKEIGVRKVLGASVESIILLFSKSMIKPMLIGFGLAAPLAGFAMHKLLEQFAYKIELGPSIFIISLLISFFIVLATVGYRSLMAAVANPVKSLRSE